MSAAPPMKVSNVWTAFSGVATIIWKPKRRKIDIERSVNSLSALSKASSRITGAKAGRPSADSPNW